MSAYIHKFILVFKPSIVYQIHSRIFAAIRKKGESLFFCIDEDIKELPVEKLDKEQLTKWTANLQTSIIFNRLCLFFSKKLRDYQKSKIVVISYVVSLLLLFIVTLISFSGINYGLYKINNEFYKYSDTPTFFAFFYYSVNNFFYNSIQEITPITTISRTVLMIEYFFTFLLIAILISLLFYIILERHKDDLDQLIEAIEKEGKQMEGFIKNEYKLNIEDAISELGKLKASFIDFIYRLSKHIE